MFFSQFSGSLIRNIDGGLGRLAQAAGATEARKQFRSAFSAFAHDPDAEVRVIALFGLFMVDRTAPLAEDLLKCLRDDIQWNHYTFTAGWGGNFITALGDVAAEPAIGALLEQKNAALAAAYCEQIMGPWMKEGGNPRLLFISSRLFTSWGAAVAQSQGKKQAAAVYERIIAALKDCLARWPDYMPGEVRRQIREVESLREKLGVAPLTAAADDPWKQYEMRASRPRIERPRQRGHRSGRPSLLYSRRVVLVLPSRRTAAPRDHQRPQIPGRRAPRFGLRRWIFRSRREEAMPARRRS